MVSDRNLKPFTDPELIVHKVDNEGWPDALEWFASDNFEDAELDQLIYDAVQQHYILNHFWEQIKARLEVLGVDVYID